MSTRSVLDVSRAADGRSSVAPDAGAKSPLSDGSARQRGRFGEGPVSGAAVMITGKIANFAVAFVSLAIVARILSPADYGLVAMVASATAFFSIFSDFGLSLVTVQRPHLSAQQLSTLFWINVGFGLLLGLLAAALGPALVWFYGDARLLAVALALALVFPVAALGTQHEAILKRNMKFRRLASVRLFSSVVSAGAGIAAALLGWGYWALVVQPLAQAAAGTLMVWMAVRWAPARPTRCEGLRGMLGFGGALTAHGMIGYFANNLDNILIGRFWGDVVLGLYATSYNLMMRPISLAGYGVGEAAIPALSRAAVKPDGLPPAFRQMLAVSCVLGLPMFVVGVIWPDDIVRTLLGPKWMDATAIVPWLFLAGLARMLMVPTGWVYVASGRPKRMLAWQLMWTPFVVLSFVIGLPHGALGVAASYAVVTCLGLGPSYAFCFRGSNIRLSDVFVTLLAPAICAVGSAVAATIVQWVAASSMVPGPWRLSLRLGIAAILYAVCTARFVPMAKDCLKAFMQRIQSPEL
jgi:O-antigen/teichoic acid export membrane protein